jgi:hypothetical protein
LFDLVEREETAVVFIRCADELGAMQDAWSRLEELVPLRGNKFFGMFDGHEYHACAQADVEGLERGTIPSGTYARRRLRGEPPDVYEWIAPTIDALAQLVKVDDSRPFIEHYRRRDEIDVLVPFAGN